MLSYLVSIVLMLMAAKTEAMECGMSGYHGYNQSRIVGGRDAYRNEYPWQALLFGGGMCGASIISKNKILTAAHCTSGTPASKFKVYVGLHYMKDDGNYKRVCRKAEYEKYDNNRFSHYDIAILTLCENLEFSESVRPVCLPNSRNEMFANDNAVATGWGSRSQSRISRALQTVSLEILDNQRCRRTYWDINDWHICAYGPGKDTCQGDSGGPLVVKHNGRYTLVGITSFGAGCARHGVPGGYARVSYFLDFINRNM